MYVWYDLPHGTRTNVKQAGKQASKQASNPSKTQGKADDGNCKPQYGYSVLVDGSTIRRFDNLTILKHTRTCITRWMDRQLLVFSTEYGRAPSFAGLGLFGASWVVFTPGPLPLDPGKPTIAPPYQIRIFATPSGCARRSQLSYGSSPSQSPQPRVP
jgi:hypothetical protein